MWYLEPDDPIEPKEVQLTVCPLCECLAEDCTEVQAHEGEHFQDWCFECPDCGSEFFDDDGWFAHECEGYVPNEDDYL